MDTPNYFNRYGFRNRTLNRILNEGNLCSEREFSTLARMPLDHDRPRIYSYFANAKSQISFSFR